MSTSGGAAARGLGIRLACFQCDWISRFDDKSKFSKGPAPFPFLWTTSKKSFSQTPQLVIVWCLFTQIKWKKKKKKHLEWKNALMWVSFKPSWGFIVDGRGSQSGCCDGRPGVPQDNYIIVSIFLYHTNDIIHVLLKYEVWSTKSRSIIH